MFVFKGNLHPDGPDKQGSRAACVMLAKTITTQKQNKTGKQEEERKQRSSSEPYKQHEVILKITLY